MEALVNYTSEDEQEESMDHPTAERGYRGHSPGKARHSYGNESTMKNRGSSGGGRRDESSSRSNNYKDESSQRQKSTSYSNNNRSETSSYNSREKTRDGRDGRDSVRDRRDNRRDNRDDARAQRDDKDQKDNRYNKDHSRHDSKSDRTRSRDVTIDLTRERDSNDSRRQPREDDRHRPTSSSSSSSSYKHNRYSGNGRDERPRYDSSSSNATSPTFQKPHHNRSYDHRHSDHNERSSERRNRRHSKSRSPSPSPNHRHYHSKRSTFDDKSHSRRRTRSRSRSATPKRSDSRERDRESHALEQARKSALDMERKIPAEDRATYSDAAHTSGGGGIRSRTEALLSLPLSETAPKQPNVIAVTPVSTSANTSEPALIQLPSYYNPNVINPNKYAEQVQKRKLIWGAKKVEDTAKKWGNAQFSQDTDGKVASKFMRLMGIKGSVAPKVDAEEVEKKAVPSVAPDVKTREVMFSNMEQQYEVARQVTHTMRGVGLGFSSQARPF